MSLSLVITSIDKLQNKVNSAIKSFKDIPGIYVCLNKTQKSTENHLKEDNINTDKMFFIDCTSSEKIQEDVLHISPSKIDLLSSAVNSFVKNIQGKKFLVIDALSTLLIYNDDHKVADFVKKISEFAAKNNVKVVAFTPKTKGKEFLNKIYNFFNKVEKQ